jgi:hypothetical protein
VVALSSESALARRTAVCLDCRTALFQEEVCDLCRGQRIASLADAVGRERLVEAAWGSPEVRALELRRSAQAEQSVTVVGMAGFFAGFLILLGLIPTVEPVHILGSAAAMALFWAAGHYALARRGHVFPVGADRQLPPRRGAMGPRGNAIGEPRLSGPATRHPCVGYAIELHMVGNWGERVMYRDAVSSGFDVYLDNGRIARIPPGRIRIVGRLRQVVDFDNLDLEEYLRQVDAEHTPNGAFDPLQYNVVYEACVTSGARVELLSSFEPAVNPRGRLLNYREAAPSVMLPQGIPVLRLL